MFDYFRKPDIYYGVGGSYDREGLLWIIRRKLLNDRWNKKDRYIRVPVHVHKTISGEVGRLSPTFLIRKHGIN